MKKDIKKITKELNRQGFVVRTTRRGHLAVQAAGVTVAVLGGTPSDRRSTRNGLARLRRAGFTYSGAV